MITQEIKKRLLAAMKERRPNFNTDKAFATFLGINPAQYSQINSGNTFQVLSDSAWVNIARVLEINLKGEEPWKVVDTEVHKKITKQLKKCQDDSISAIFCDEADIGKTTAAKDYAKKNKYVAYIDCSLCKNKQQLVRAIAKAFGLNHTERFSEVWHKLAFYLNNVATNPLVILDEAGDLDKTARLELKALWNVTEKNCGWYQMGADALKEIIQNGIKNKIVGFTETFSRYGSRFQKSLPVDAEEKKKFIMRQASLIIRANAPADADVQGILVRTNGSLRRINYELSKLAKK